jgi:hypothetical protein
MTDIKEFKISLMEKQGALDVESKSEYLLRTSATFEFNKYIEEAYPGADEEDKEYILKEICKLVFEDLVTKTQDKFDSVGVWIKIGDEILENSIDLAVMEGIKQYGEPEIVPIFELVKMTLPKDEISS